MAHVFNEDIRYRLLKILEENPEVSQRDLSKALGVSLGKVNYCLQALIEKGLIKAANFRNSRNKAAYMYVLTPKGIEEKIRVTHSFLTRKVSEYDALAREIERLRIEVASDGADAAEQQKGSLP